jgi:hypothetical protein
MICGVLWCFVVFCEVAITKAVGEKHSCDKQKARQGLASRHIRRFYGTIRKAYPDRIR